MRSIEEAIKIHIPCIPLIVQANHIACFLGIHKNVVHMYTCTKCQDRLTIPK